MCVCFLMILSPYILFFGAQKLNVTKQKITADTRIFYFYIYMMNIKYGKGLRRKTSLLFNGSLIPIDNLRTF